MSSQAESPTEPKPGAPEVGGPYARYVLGVLVLVYVFNFLDRQIISILAEEIRADLGLSDAQIGFLYGTAFAVFYAIFGIPLGRVADVWRRRSLIAVGLGVWSAMTALSGLARSFGQLAVARVGVGVGEASATPAAFSMLSDYFPPARRATVLAIYSSGIYIGGGLGLGIGGLVVDTWNEAWAGGTPPLGLRGWQVAYLVVGLPGLLMALWVRSLREPVRGLADGVPTRTDAQPFRVFIRELRAVLPPLTLWHLASVGAGAAGLARNLAAAAGLAAGAAGLVALTGDVAQWSALAVGLYAAVSWTQALRLSEPESFERIFRTRSLVLGALGFSFLAFTGYGIGFWVPPFVQRIHGASAAESGLVLGATAAAAGLVGVTLGGVLADRWRIAHRAGRLRVGMLAAILPIPLVVWFLTTEDLRTAYLLNFPMSVLAAMWIGAAASTVQDLVPPRMRGTASAAYLLVITFVGLALGPYGIGKISAVSGSLRTGMLASLAANGLACLLLAAASRHLVADEAAARGDPSRSGNL